MAHKTLGMHAIQPTLPTGPNLRISYASFTSAGATVISAVDSLLCPTCFWTVGRGTPLIRAETTWLCLRIWGVSFLRESFFLGETSWEACKAENIDGLTTIGYQGAAFDGQYVYFSPPGLGFNAAGWLMPQEPYDLPLHHNCHCYWDEIELEGLSETRWNELKVEQERMLAELAEVETQISACQAEIEACREG